eukprot:9470024-Pyramimonas_sp.AAC.2
MPHGTGQQQRPSKVSSPPWATSMPAPPPPSTSRIPGAVAPTLCLAHRDRTRAPRALLGQRACGRGNRP